MGWLQKKWWCTSGQAAGKEDHWKPKAAQVARHEWFQCATARSGVLDGEMKSEAFRMTCITLRWLGRRMLEVSSTSLDGIW